MRNAYEALLRLYPDSWRVVFGPEMASVFEQASGEYQPRGSLAYAAFLRTEFSGLIAGAFSAWTNEYMVRSRRRLNAPFVVSLLAGSLITAFCQGCLYTGREGVGRGFPLQIRVPETPQSSLTLAVPLILAIGCLLLISVLSAAFVLNMRVIGNRAGRLKPIWMPGRAATRITRRGRTPYWKPDCHFAQRGYPRKIMGTGWILPEKYDLLGRLDGQP
jgi:hypothetical protein